MSTEHATDIAVFAAHLELGGAERMAVTMANGLASRGHTVDMVLADARGPYLDEVSESVRLVSLNAGRLRRAVTPLKSYLRQRRPRVLLSSLPVPNVVATLACMGVKPAPRLVLRECSVPSHARRHYSRQVRFAYAVAPVLYRRAAAILAVSSGVAEELRDLFRLPASLIHVLHDPARPPLAHVPEDAPHPWLADQRETFGNGVPPSRPPVLISAGRLTRLKGVDRLISALAMHPELRAARALILGDGPARRELEEQSRALGVSDRICFAGRVDEPRAWMARADALVVTSHFESWCGVIVEALQVGTPVVSVDCPHGPREILDRGRYGRLVPSGEPMAIGAAIAETLRCPPDRVTLRERASEFSPEIILQQLERALNL